MYAAHGLVHAYMIVFPTVLILVREDYDQSWFRLGALATASAMAFGLLGLPAGYVTDRLGPRRVLLLSLGGSAAACLVAGLSPNLVTLGAALVLLGASGGFYHPSALTLITNSLSRSGRALGMHGVGGNIGMAIAPFALAAFASAAGWHAAFLFMAAVGFAFTLGATRGLPRVDVRHRTSEPPALVAEAPGAEGGLMAEGTGAESERATAEESSPEPSEAGREALVPLALVYLMVLTLGFVYNGFVAFLPSYLSEQAPGALMGVLAGGALTTAVLLVGIAGQWGGGHAADWGRAREGYLASAVVVGVAGVAMWAATGWLLVLAASMLSLLLFAGQPMGNSLLAGLSSARRRGLAFGLSFSLGFGVGSLATTLMGYVADWGGLRTVFLFLGISTLPAVAAGALLVRRPAVRQTAPSAGRYQTTTQEVQQ